MKIMLVGDTHGDIRNVEQKVRFAKQVGDIQRIFVLGDFGFWWGYEGVKYLDDCNDLARDNNLQIFALPGNHEFYEGWKALVDNAQATAHGFAYVRTNVLLSPRVHDFVWGNKQFVVTGGAVSIDKDYREEYRRTKGKRIWSPDEQLTDEEVNQVTVNMAGIKTDYLLTHDCSNFTPFRDRLKPDMDSQIHRQRIDKVIANVNPRMHFHGHMHTKYEWNNTLNTDAFGATPSVSVDTYGLECNTDQWSWGILDLVADKFEWGWHVLNDLP